jgi:hypothetical protein
MGEVQIRYSSQDHPRHRLLAMRMCRVWQQMAEDLAELDLPRPITLCIGPSELHPDHLMVDVARLVHKLDSHRSPWSSGWDVAIRWLQSNLAYQLARLVARQLGMPLSAVPRLMNRYLERDVSVLAGRTAGALALQRLQRLDKTPARVLRHDDVVDIAS